MKTLEPSAAIAGTSGAREIKNGKIKPGPGKHGCILVVDDEETVGIGMCEILKNAGFNAFYVTSGNDAVLSVKSTACSLIFMDMMMPGLSGLETYRKIRDVSPASKVVLFTGYYKEVDNAIYNGVREGMIDVLLRKPFYAEEIISAALKFS